MIQLQRDCGQFVWMHHTPRMAYNAEDAFIIGYRVGRERRRIYARSSGRRARAAVARMLAAYGR